MERKPNRRTAAQMYPLIEQWQQSDQSRTEFCEVHQINLHTFTYWLHKKQKAEESTSGQFIALEISPSRSIRGDGLKICYPNGVNIQFPENTRVDYVKSLLQIQV